MGSRPFDGDDEGHDERVDWTDFGRPKRSLNFSSLSAGLLDEYAIS